MATSRSSSASAPDRPPRLTYSLLTPRNMQHTHADPASRNERVIVSFFETLAAGRIEEALAAWADNAVDHTTVANAPPGKPGVRATLEFVRAVFPSAHWRVTRVVAAGDGVACQLVVDGRQDGAIYGVPPTGRHVQWRHFHYFRLHDGRIVEHDAVCDDRDLLRQLCAAT